ncbi:MAG TPA: VWA domain-containing protein [Bryobacteraceae bacterium]|nr:VWA domain-containing protein [Bryobacteraceae bacterium]
MECRPVVAMNKLLGIILLLAALPAAAQPVAADSESAIKVDVDVVNVLCTVYDRRGALVRDLAKDDFEVLENGRRQEIRYFARDTDLPLTVALLVDVSGSVRALIGAEKDAAAKFLQAVIRPSDQALLAGFSSSIVLWQDFTPSVERLSNALSRMHAVPFHGLPPQGLPMPGTLLYDTVYVTAHQKLADVSGRKVMVIISDGLDNGSLNHSQDAIAAVQSANAVVYGICYQSGFSGCDFLKELAGPTGGRMFQAGKKTPLSDIFHTIEDELRSQYALGYVPEDRTRDGAFRKLQVRTLRRGLRVQARKGYYARRDEESGTDSRPAPLRDQK